MLFSDKIYVNNQRLNKFYERIHLHVILCSLRCLVSEEKLPMKNTTEGKVTKNANSRPQLKFNENQKAALEPRLHLSLV